MVSLIDVSYVRSRTNLPDDSGVNQAIQHAIDASTPLLEAKLATVFSKRSVVDTFYLNSSYPKHHGFYVLKLSGGFVRLSPALSALYGDSMQLIATALDLTECKLKGELGHLYVPESYAGAYLNVSYDHGYVEGDLIPAWLQEAAYMHTLSLLSAQQIGDPKPELSEVFKYMMESSATILDSHIRSRSYTLSPL